MNDINVLYPSATPSTTPAAPAKVDAPSAPAATPAAAKADAPAVIDKAVRAPVQLSERAQRLEKAGNDRLRDVRWNEIPIERVEDFSAYFPGGIPDHEADGVRAAVKLGLGATQMAALTELARSTLKPDYAPPSDEECLEVLRSRWGKDANGKIAKAREIVARVTKIWPGFTEFLERTRLGSHPTMIRLLAEKAERIEKAGAGK